MSAYLLDHPPRRNQYRVGRRAKPTGTIVLHTAENTPDLAGPDLGAEGIARFISTRTDAAGSYHLLGDRDSEILVVNLNDDGDVPHTHLFTPPRQSLSACHCNSAR